MRLIVISMSNIQAVAVFDHTHIQSVAIVAAALEYKCVTCRESAHKAAVAVSAAAPAM